MSTKIIALFLLLLSSAAALSSYSYTATTGINDNIRSISLGSLTASDVLTLLVEFPNPATGAGPTMVYPVLFDNAMTQLSPQPSGFGSANAVAINFTGSNTFTWTVSTTGTYNLKIKPSNIAYSFVPYKLTVTNSNGGVFAKVSDALRLTYLAMFHLASTQTIYHISTTYNGIMILNSMDVSNVWTRISESSSNSSGYYYSNLPAGDYVIQT